MINKAIPLVGALVLSACASTTDVPAAADASPEKLGVTHVGKKQNVEHVFCMDGDRGDCPARTRKVVALPAPEPVAPPRSTAKTLPPVEAKVHFRWGWSRLDGDGQKEVADLLAVPGIRAAKSIVIAGRTDPSGGLKANQKLALKRAQTVKAALVMEGIPEAIITAESQLPCCDGDKNASPGVMRGLRRTDITITITTK